MNRNYKKLKSIEDFATLDAPTLIADRVPFTVPKQEQAILRMLVRPEYGSFKIPKELKKLKK
jgi:hypothetical protein